MSISRPVGFPVSGAVGAGLSDAFGYDGGGGGPLGIYAVGIVVGDSFTNSVNHWPNLVSEPTTLYNSTAAPGQNLTTIKADLVAEIADKTDADFAIIQGGVNDLLGSAAVATMKTLATDMVQLCIDANLDCLIMNIAPFNNHLSWTAAMETDRVIYNSHLDDLVVSHGCGRIDIGRGLEDVADAESLDVRLGLATDDGLHPGVSGDKFIPAFTITSSGTTATATHTAHELRIGDLITVTGAIETNYNVTDGSVLSIADADTFTYTIVATTSPATGSPVYIRKSGSQVIADITDSAIIGRRANVSSDLWHYTNLSATEITALAAFIAAEKSDGNWATTDEYFILALTDDQDEDQYIGLKNLDNLYIRTGTPSNAGANGVTFAANNSNLQMQITTRSLTQFSTDPAYVSCYYQAVTPPSANVYSWGSHDAVALTSMQSINDTNLSCRMVAANTIIYPDATIADTPTPLSLWSVKRVSTNTTLDQDGVQVDLQVAGTKTVPDQYMVLNGAMVSGTLNNNGLASTMAFFCIGGAVDTSAQTANVDALLQALGTTGA